MEKKIIKVGLDLDGVIVDKPPLVSRNLIEFLTKKPANSSLHFRFPKSFIEQYVRKFSHFYLFRPPLRENVDFVKRLNPRNYELYIISGRYSFLTSETDFWLKKRGLEDLFKAVFINLGNEQPHLFKERVINDLGLDYFFEDDPDTVAYLNKKISKTKIFLVSQEQAVPSFSKWLNQ